MGFFDDLRNIDDATIASQAPPSQQVVDWFHGKASSGRAEDMHHAIGIGINDAASGAHTHNGKDSYPLFTPVSLTLTDITGAATGPQIQAAVNSINAALRLLGAG